MVATTARWQVRIDVELADGGPHPAELLDRACQTLRFIDYCRVMAGAVIPVEVIHVAADDHPEAGRP
jgi:hypothetical protein